jgi:hypothetical protein
MQSSVPLFGWRDTWRSFNNVGFEVLGAVAILGHNVVQSVESQPAFQRNISPPSSESKTKPSKKPT